MKLHELQQKRDTIAKQMRALHDEIGDNAWTEEQRKSWDGAKNELNSLDEQIKRELELREMDKKAVIDNEPSQRSNPDNPEIQQTELRSKAFDKYIRQGFGELNAEERNAIQELRAQSVGADEKGGYTVPTVMLNKIVDAMKAYGGIASISQILTTSTGQNITWSTSDGTLEEGELLGENSAASEEDTKFGSAILGAKKLSSKIIRVSNELLQDSGVDIEAYLSARIAQRIGRGEAKYLIQGSGEGTPLQPKGLNASVTGVTSTASATAFTWEEILDLKHSLDPAYRNSETFRLAFNDNTLKAISKMKDAQGRPLWLPDVVGMAPASVLNTPYVIDQGIDDIAAGKKFIFCGDFNRFIIRRVAYMTLKRLVERYAEFDQTAFLAFHRFDCVLEDTAAIKALVGKSAAR